MRAFVTGGHGFVGGYLRAHLDECGDDVVAPEEFEVTDARAVTDAVVGAAPDALYHLAALTHVGESWSSPVHTFEVNAVGTLHVLEAARACERPPVVILVGSAEVYGIVTPGDLPLHEDHPLRPVSPYAVSKVAAEYLGLQAHLAYRVPVISVRAFNHVGPRQAPTFVVSDFARQIAAAERTGAERLRVGNLTPRRDFTDVRDVVRAYRLLAERGRPGETYNVCSGRDVQVEELARRLLAISGREMRLDIDPALARPVDVPVLRGDPSKLREATGWEPRVPLDETLRDVLDYWRTELATTPST